MTHYLIMIISCARDSKFHATLREISLQSMQIPYFFILGNPNIKQSQLVEDILTVPCDDSYEYLTHKIYYALKYVMEHLPQIKGVWKFDIDTYFDPIKFPKYMRIAKNYHYAGHNLRPIPKNEKDIYYYRRNLFLTRPQPKPSFLGRYFSGGKGYYLSRHSLEQIVIHLTNQGITEWYEDKMIGDTLRQVGIIKNETDMFLILPKFRAFHFNMFNSTTDYENTTFICGLTSDKIIYYLQNRDKIKTHNDFTKYVTTQ